MSQLAMATQSSREIALARRKAMSSSGKSAIKNAAAVKSTPVASGAAKPTAGGRARSASLARRQAMSSRGKAAVSSQDRTRISAMQDQNFGNETINLESSKQGCGCGCGGAGKSETSDNETAVPSSRVDNAASSETTRRPSRARISRRPVIASTSTAKTAALARRKSMSARGKAGLANSSMSEAQAARASNPKMSGRELAQMIRDQRSRRGGSRQPKSAPRGRLRKSKDTNVGAAQDAPWKVGASETSSGQTVTGTMVGRHNHTTGDEPSTCRSVTGTEYMGADIFRQFCQSDAKTTTAKKVAVTSTSHGNSISGNRMGRASNVTGNEPGTCKRVTGGEYVSAEQTQAYCGELAKKSPRKVSMADTMKNKIVTGNHVGRSENVTGDEYGMRHLLTGTQYTKPANIGETPSKVGASTTLRGGSVTGTMVGRRERMTGDEPGSCRNVTGDDYIGQEQFNEFCDATPKPKDRKVNESNTLNGMNVTGSLDDRSQRVTGNEPGTCKTVTGTPYASGNQYQEFCEAPQAAAASARMHSGRKNWGQPMTGQQPGIGGHLTGADKGACEPLTGTPYVGADQAAGACPATAAEPGSPDFPQSIEQTQWGDFSVSTPTHATHYDMSPQNVTGNHYETGQITGPFGMADGKVTGTEQARFDKPQAQTVTIPPTQDSLDGRVKSRITGEGMNAGQRITGDDWERGDHVTGTEGVSATRRNPTLRGGAMVARPVMARPENIPEPVSKVTGGSGNTGKGSLITYSGGARG